MASAVRGETGPASQDGQGAADARVIAVALQRYGMILAGNTGAALEVVDTTGLVNGS